MSEAVTKEKLSQTNLVLVSQICIVGVFALVESKIMDTHEHLYPYTCTGPHIFTDNYVWFQFLQQWRLPFCCFLCAST